jgi:hypothetical protein
MEKKWEGMGKGVFHHSKVGELWNIKMISTTPLNWAATARELRGKRPKLK